MAEEEKRPARPELIVLPGVNTNSMLMDLIKQEHWKNCWDDWNNHYYVDIYLDVPHGSGFYSEYKDPWTGEDVKRYYGIRMITKTFIPEEDKKKCDIKETVFIPFDKYANTGRSANKDPRLTLVPYKKGVSWPSNLEKSFWNICEQMKRDIETVDYYLKEHGLPTYCTSDVKPEYVKRYHETLATLRTIGDANEFVKVVEEFFELQKGAHR